MSHELMNGSQILDQDLASFWPVLRRIERFTLLRFGNGLRLEFLQPSNGAQRGLQHGPAVDEGCQTDVKG